MQKPSILIAIAISVLSAAMACAHTWHVEQDGSGDFLEIQDAIVAAAEGDTILVGPGHYVGQHEIPGATDHTATVAFDKPGLVLLGESVDTVRIGEDDTSANYHAIAGLGIASAAIGNVTVNGGSDGVVWEAGGLEVRHSRFENCVYGVVIYRGNGCDIFGCTFQDLE